jgi:hypothetical protein
VKESTAESRSLPAGLLLTDGELTIYWQVLAFSTPAQRSSFCCGCGVTPEVEDCFFNALRMARRLQIDLRRLKPPFAVQEEEGDRWSSENPCP